MIRLGARRCRGGAERTTQRVGVLRGAVERAALSGPTTANTDLHGVGGNLGLAAVARVDTACDRVAARLP